MEFSNAIFTEAKVKAVNALMEQPLEAVEAYKLAKFAKELSAKQEIFNTAKLGIFKKYGKEKDGQIEIKGKKLALAQKELEALVELKETYPLEEKIKIPKKGITLAAAQVLLLEDIVDFEG